MLESEKNDGDIILRYSEVKSKLAKEGLYVYVWGRIAISTKATNLANTMIANNFKTITEVEAFYEGYMARKI